MEIIPLGVGSAFAKTLENTNFLIKTGDGVSFLLDCGHTATRSLTRLSFNPSDIAGILISHLHADHISGLEEMGFTGLFEWGRRVDIHLPKPLLPYLWEGSLKGGMGQRLKTGEGKFVDAKLSTYFTVNQLSTGKVFRIGSVEVTPFRTPHIPGRPSFGFTMKETLTGRSVMFSCDSQLSMRNLAKYGRDAEIIFHDCQLNGSAEGIHALLDDLVRIPGEYRAKTLLVHYGDEWGNYLGKTGGMSFAEELKTYSL